MEVSFLYREIDDSILFASWLVSYCGGVMNNYVVLITSLVCIHGFN